MVDRRTLLKAFSGAPMLIGAPGETAPTRAYSVWDVHCHLVDVPGETPVQRMAQLVKYADRVGIERMVVFMGLALIADPSPEQLRGQNDQVLEALRHFPQRVFGFVYLSPNHLQFSLDELNRCVRDGPMVGVKLWIAKHCNAPELDPIVERAAALKAVIYQHTWLKRGGNLRGESTPFDVAELARRHPAIPMICGHAGGDWERGIRAVRALPNVAVDIAGSDPTAGMVEMAVRELGPERILYGSDAGIRSFASQLAKVAGAAIPEPAKRLILSGNLRRMLDPILASKGVKL